MLVVGSLSNSNSRRSHPKSHEAVIVSGAEIRISVQKVAKRSGKKVDGGGMKGYFSYVQIELSLRD
jgi:hypothetical protein